MCWVKRIVVLLLVAIWLPASSHALLQHAGFIHQQHEDEHDPHSDADHHGDSDGRHEHDADNHAAADGLCLLAMGKLQVPAPPFVATLGWLLVALLPPSAQANGMAFHTGLSPPGTTPPELSHIWQFSFRTALPVRAPSHPS
jgi:hypothetical protein